MATTTKPSTAKPRKRSTSSARKTSVPSRARAKAQEATATPRAAEPESTGHGIGDKVGAIGTAVRHEAGTVAKGAAAAAIGTALATLGGRALIASRRQKRVLGVPLPRRHTSVHGIAKQVADMAGQLEQKSADVSKASARAKHAAKALA